MKNLGDIKQLNGSNIPIVDCITGGSPCQDLSVAGKRAGLSGERSGLFMEQVRIVREMRELDKSRGRTGHLVRPRFMVWENVPGAFSSGSPKGADFAAVIEEILKICEPGADVRISVPDKGWPKFGCYYADDGSWSIAWRVHDAQFWGVPQRRKRIALVADFGGLSAPEVLFERKSLRRDTDESETAGEETAGGTGTGADGTIWCIKEDAIDRDTNANGRWVNEDVSHTLDATDRHGVAVLNDQGGSMMSVTREVTGTLRSQEHGHQPISEETAPTLNAEKNPAVYDARGNGNGAISPTPTGDHQNRVTDYTAVVAFAKQSHGDYKKTEFGSTQNARQGKSATDLVCYGLDSNKNGYQEQAGAIQAHTSGGATELCVDRQMTVRRLTPLECERLQGYPDGWTDIGEWTDSKGKKRHTSDTAGYKALGNSIALPFWFWLLRRISAQYERPATLGSLFDGIGGFPLCWERCNGKGTAVWASEIEEFPMAATNRRFGDD